MAATEPVELTVEQLAALEQLGSALAGVQAAMAGCELVGLDPMAAIGQALRDGLTEEQLAEIPLPLRMMIG
jgi:hypothetical protein